MPHIPPSLALLPLLATTSLAESATTRAEAALDTLQSWYNTSSGIWDSCGWWNGANCMTAIADLALLDDADKVNETARGVFENTFAVATTSNPIPERGSGTYYKNATNAPARAVEAAKWLDGSYDDDAWWALAWIAAYDHTKNSDYLELAEGIFDNLNQTYPSKCGGGIDSDYSQVYVNAVTNELYISLAAHLANRASDTKTYLSWAQSQWTWFNGSGMINENYTINDGLLDDCTNNGAPIYSYNQGIILGALTELHTASPNTTNTTTSPYIQTAHKIAKGAISALADKNHIIHDSCDTEADGCDANATQFKGIFIRNLRHLHSVSPDKEYETVLTACADSIWASDRDAEGKFGNNWAGPVGDVDASTHSSAMDALVAVVEE